MTHSKEKDNKRLQQLDKIVQTTFLSLLIVGLLFIGYLMVVGEMDRAANFMGLTVAVTVLPLAMYMWLRVFSMGLKSIIGK